MAIYGVLIAISIRAVLNVLVAYMVNCEQFLLWLKVNTIGILSLLLRNDSVVKNGIFLLLVYSSLLTSLSPHSLSQIYAISISAVYLFKLCM